MAKENVIPNMVVKLSPEIVSAQGKNDREYLTLRMKLLLEAIDKHPKVPIDVIAKLAGSQACGQGCCCCCGPCCNVPNFSPIETIVETEK
jgi:hypothetical protein